MRSLKEVVHYRGDTSPIGFRITNSAGVPQPITGRTYRVTVSRNKTPDAAAAPGDQVVQWAATVTDEAAGELTVTPSATDFDALGTPDFTNGVADLFYDLEETSGAEVYTYGVGSFTLVLDISK